MDYFRPTKLPIDPFGTPDTGFRTFRVTSPYGTRADPLGQSATVFHGGLDIGNARLGDAVTAIARGIVIIADNQPHPHFNAPSPPSKRAEWGPSYGGLMVVIRHPDGRWSQYAHLGGKAVAVGDHVPEALIIGAVGESGSAHGMGHLHFGIRDPQQIGNGHDGFIDPWPLIDATSQWEDPIVIAELKQKLEACQKRVKALLVKRDALQGQIDALEAEIVTLEAEAAKVPELQTKVRHLRVVVKRLRDELASEEVPDA